MHFDDREVEELIPLFYVLLYDLLLDQHKQKYKVFNEDPLRIRMTYIKVSFK